MADHEDQGQKTEEATPRRRAEAREKGQVPISSELIAAVALCIGAGSLVLGGGRLVDALGSETVRTIRVLGDLGQVELDVPRAAAILNESITSVLGALAIVTFPAILLGAVAGFVQVGFRIAPKAIEPDLSKFDLVKGLKRFVSVRSFVRTALSTLKVLLITTVVAVIAWQHVGGIIRSSTNELGPLMVAVGHVGIRCLAGALVVILALAIVDLVFQRYQHERDLRMSKHELKEEARLTDGDPKVRARIRRVQQELAMRRMMSDVPDATVVVTNPTHYAVALRYERAQDALAPAAPVVVAKGADHLAQRIKSVAAEAGVPRYEDVSLARALYAEVGVGEEIPEKLYAAVAAVLGYVYRLRGVAGARPPAHPMEASA